MLTPYLPYPLYSGGQIRSYNLLKSLSEDGYKITLVSFVRGDWERENLTYLKNFCEEIVVFKRGKAWRPRNIFLSTFTLMPFLLSVYWSPLFKKKLQDALKHGNFDVIHVETFYMMHNLPKNVGIPVVLAEQNIEYLVYKRYVDTISRWFFIKPALYFDVLKIRKWEEHFWKKADQLIVMSEQDKKKTQREDVVVIPNGADVKKFKMQRLKPKSDKEKIILFIGNFKWMQNRDAAFWLLKEIWPHFVRLRRTKIKLWIVGKGIPQSIRRLGIDNVTFDEYAPDDTSLIYKKADVLLAPVRVGGGTKFKILESMASGLPVVTTKIGIEGIEAKEGREVLLGETAEDLASMTLEVLRAGRLREKLARNARVLIEEKYDWKKIVKKLEKVYESAVSNSHA